MSNISASVDAVNLPGLVIKYIFPWFEVLGETIKICRQILIDLATVSAYKVLDFQVHLELQYTEGNPMDRYSRIIMMFLIRNNYLMN